MGRSTEPERVVDDCWLERVSTVSFRRLVLRFGFEGSLGLTEKIFWGFEGVGMSNEGENADLRFALSSPIVPVTCNRTSP